MSSRGVTAQRSTSNGRHTYGSGNEEEKRLVRTGDEGKGSYSNEPFLTASVEQPMDWYVDNMRRIVARTSVKCVVQRIMGELCGTTTMMPRLRSTLR